jgi:uncharacterized protein (TIGR02246 family)
MKQAIEAVLRSYKAAVYAKDVEAFVALYDKDVQIFDAWGPWSYRGIDEWRASVQGWFESLGSDKVVVDVDDLQVHGNDGIAAAHAILTFTAVSPEGVTLRALNNRVTLILTSAGGPWRIVHEHTSAPADFGTKQVALHR